MIEANRKCVAGGRWRVPGRLTNCARQRVLRQGAVAVVVALFLTAVGCSTRPERVSGTENDRPVNAQPIRAVSAQPGVTSAPNPSVPTVKPRANTPPASPVSAPSAGTDACAGAPPAKAWLTNAGCVSVQRCPGVPGPCRTSCVPLPQQCVGCSSCSCLSLALCGYRSASACKGYEVQCAAP